MADYIDREMARSKACNGCTRHVNGACYDPEPCEKLLAAFVSAPSADVAPVVKCQVCEFAIEELHGLKCTHWNAYTYRGGFCYYGSRKTQEGGAQCTP